MNPAIEPSRDQDEAAPRTRIRHWWLHRKYFGALLVGFYEGKKVKFGGRVGTGFSEKLLRTLFSDLDKIGVENSLF